MLSTAELLNDAREPLTNIACTVAGLMAGQFWGGYRARQKWKALDSTERVNVSLNIFSDGRLRIRTIFERPLGEIVANRHAKNLVLASAKKADKYSPLLRLPESDMRFVLNCILNATAEHFILGSVRRDCGQRVLSADYALFLTCEVAKETRHRKIRAMLLKKESLENFSFRDEDVRLESPTHRDRVITLRRASELYKTDPGLFAHLELCV
jgi:hypothetical protein